MTDEFGGTEPASFADLFLYAIDATTQGVVGRPIKPRVKMSVAGFLRGELDVVKIEVPAMSVAGLLVDRFVIRAERLRIVMGFPPRLRAGPVGLKGVVSQDNVNAWMRASRLPVNLKLSADGIVATTNVAGIRMSEVEVELDVVGPLVRLKPARATVLGVNAPLMRLVRGYLPLPPLPKGARLDKVEPGDGELAVYLRIDEVDEPITPVIARRLRSSLGLR